jgi:hypothetical protein
VADAKTVSYGLIAHICSVLKQLISNVSGNVRLNGSKPLTYLITNKLPWMCYHCRPRVMVGTSSPPEALRLRSEGVVCCRKCVSILLHSTIVSKRKQHESFKQSARHCNNLGIRLWERILTAHSINTCLWRASTLQSTFIGILCVPKGYTVQYLGTSSILTTLLY